MSSDATEARDLWPEIAACLQEHELPEPVLEALEGATACAGAGHLLGAIDLVIANVDEALSEFIDSVLHEPAFQRLDASWRGLRFVVDQVAFHENVRITLWSCSKQSLADDFEESTETSRTRLYFHAYSEQLGQFGGKPYAVILADMDFDATPQDVALLRNIGAIAAVTHAPVFHGVARGLLGLDDFRDLPRIQEVPALFQGPDTVEWNSFRNHADSRFAGPLLGRPLHRVPYRDESSFNYTETIAADGSGLLWGHPVYTFGARLAASFARYRTLSAIVGDGEDSCPAPASMHFESLGPRYSRPALETTVTPRLERALREAGVTALMHRPMTQWIYLASANSLQLPRRFGDTDGGREATLSYLLGTRFPYFLFACRIAHYAKVLERELIGSHRTPASIEDHINKWLARFVINQDATSPSLRARYPLRYASAKVKPASAPSDWFEADLLLRPHLKYLSGRLSLTISDRLLPR